MGKRALRRKLRSIRLNALQKAIVILGLLATALMWVAEQLAGNAVVNFVYKPLTQALGVVFGWSVDHPGQISMMIFALSFIYLVRQIAHDTRSIKEIVVTIDNKMLTHGAVLITNHTGDDLFNCTLDIVRVDSVAAQDRHLMWYEGVSEEDIKNGRYAFFYLQELGRSLVVGKNNGKPIYGEKIHEVELFFRGNTLKNTTLSARIWIPVVVKQMGLSEAGQPMHRVFLAGNMEISPPNFGRES